MFRYDFDKSFDDMRVMSRDKVPEKFLMNNGECVVFRDPLTEQMHILPFVMDSKGVNMYGEAMEWSPVPVGYSDTVRNANSPMERIRSMKLDATNSVIMRNDLFGGNDYAYIESMVNELVDNHMTMNQLQLIAKCPFVFHVSPGNEVDAKNFFLAMCQDKPAIFTYDGGDFTPVTESTNMKIDPALFELFDRFECQILTYIGFPCVPITKRAQQTVSEVQSNDAKLYARRMEKYNQRANACERVRDMFGVEFNVHSVIDDVSAADGCTRPRTGTPGDDMPEIAKSVSEGDEGNAE